MAIPFKNYNEKYFKYLLIIFIGAIWAFAVNFTLSFQSPKITFFSAIALPLVLSLIHFFRRYRFGIIIAYFCYWLMVFIVTFSPELNYGSLFSFVGLPLLGLTSVLIFPPLFESLRLKQAKKITFLLLFALTAFSLQYVGFKKIIYLATTPSVTVKKIMIPELVSPDKQTVSIEKFNNKIIVLLFWSKHCGACKKNYPFFQQLKQSYFARTDIFFSAVNTGEKCSFDDYVELCNKYNYDINYTMDQSESLIKQLNIDAVPTTVVIDKESNVRFIRTGFNAAFGNEYISDLSEFIEKL